MQLINIHASPYISLIYAKKIFLKCVFDKQSKVEIASISKRNYVHRCIMNSASSLLCMK